MLRIGSEPSVFISHSKYDVDSITFFSKVLANVGLKGTFMEWEKLEKEYAGSRIADIIRSNIVQNTQAVVVLLGKNLANPPTLTPQYTHNWVNFEVGVSTGCRKPIWVFERFNEDVQFPIPYVTDYVRYDLDDVEHLRVIGKILKQNVNYPNSQKPPSIITCPYTNCNAKYNYWNTDSELNCPVCRQGISLRNEGT